MSPFWCPFEPDNYLKISCNSDHSGVVILCKNAHLIQIINSSQKEPALMVSGVNLEGLATDSFRAESCMPVVTSTNTLLQVVSPEVANPPPH